MKLMPRPSTIPMMTGRGASAAIFLATPVSPSTSQISPVARLAAQTVAAVIVAVCAVCVAATAPMAFIG